MNRRHFLKLSAATLTTLAIPFISSGTELKPGVTIREWDINRINNDYVVFMSKDHGIKGTSFPIGTVRMPVSNLKDAKLIAKRYNINRIEVM